MRDFETLLGLDDPAFRQAVIARLANRQPLVQSNAPTKKRRQPIALNYTFTQNGTVNVAVQPQVLFRGEKVLAGATFSDGTTGAGATFINAIFVGNQSQFPSLQNAISTEAFGVGVLDNELVMDTCQPAIFIQVQVTCNVANWNQRTSLIWGMVIFGSAVM